MRLIVTKAQAIEAARSYAALYDVPWVGAAKVLTFRAWWFTVEAYQFDIDTGGIGSAVAIVEMPFRGVAQFQFHPKDPGHFWVPPWGAFPFYTKATMGWREGSGEVYIGAWFDWFRALPDGRQVAYRERFPAPNRDGWLEFYDWDKQTT